MSSKHTPQNSPNVSKPNHGVQLQDEEIGKLCLLLISENASSPPGQKLVVGKNPILPLFDVADTAFASKHRHEIWRRNNSKMKTRRRELVCKVTKVLSDNLDTLCEMIQRLSIITRSQRYSSNHSFFFIIG